jgi:hypothetical protein
VSLESMTAQMMLHFADIACAGLANNTSFVCSRAPEKAEEKAIEAIFLGAEPPHNLRCLAENPHR